MLQQSADSSRKSIHSLRNSLLTHKLVMPLFILLAQMRANAEYTSEEDQHLKLIGDLADKVRFILFV